jgi:hypothetical protein
MVMKGVPRQKGLSIDQATELVEFLEAKILIQKGDRAGAQKKLYGLRDAMMAKYKF